MKITQEPTDFRPIHLTLETGTEALCLFDIVSQFAKQHASSQKSCDSQQAALAGELAGMLSECLGGSVEGYEEMLGKPKIEVSITKKPVSEYPKLMRRKYLLDSYIVAFYKPRCGVVVESNNPDREAGEVDEMFYMDCFEDYEPEGEFPRIVQFNDMIVCATARDENGRSFSGYVLEDLKYNYTVGKFDEGWSCSAFGL